MVAKITRDPSFTLLTVHGVPVRVQASVIFLPAFGAAAGLLGGGVQKMMFMLGLVAALYVCASLHELGHIVPACLCGTTVTRVRVLGLGAYVQVESRTGTKPYQELLIALGGPLASGLLTLGLGLAAWPALVAQGMGLFLDPGGPMLLASLAVTNALLTVFNLLPVFPLDGGRALNAVLAMFMRPPQAMHVVSVFGQLTAVALVSVAFIGTGDLLVRGVSAGLAAMIFRVSQRTERASRRQQQA